MSMSDFMKNRSTDKIIGTSVIIFYKIVEKTFDFQYALEERNFITQVKKYLY